MLDELLALERVDEALREAEKARLIIKVKGSREDGTSRYLSELMCRIGLISTC
jgi:hypothetical protein